ncbi:hypothetical protein BpHYR1_005029 [Brachionus plicatilis]|uniref:SWIM-type domain-containing protein n=1 Tax=Brachionus plicatilis TaxID=10195 RepID=A0A3M7QUT7_BRAPC|nr:hypothetical protein BpHYR1_005029 [Brachionus plicatilis]
MDGSCRWYIKNNICKHLIGISKIPNIPGCEIPLSAKNIPIGEKRKPGRPAKSKQALIVQKIPHVLGLIAREGHRVEKSSNIGLLVFAAQIFTVPKARLPAPTTLLKTLD